MDWESLVKQVIFQFLRDITSFLLQLAKQASDRQKFAKGAKDAVWVAFPERAVSELAATGDLSLEDVEAISRKHARPPGMNTTIQHQSVRLPTSLNRKDGDA